MSIIHLNAKMKREIPKIYDASVVEDEIYSAWEKSGFFNPDKLPGKRKKAFTISMPPPNATGILHIGHAMFLTLQDLVIRFQRMLGKKALWLPGTDHAAIATQTKVEKLLQEEGKNKYDFGREKFLDRVDEFVKGSQHTIRMQIRKMGSSCDWSRERFTLDKGLSEAVKEAFVRMYNDGLIYRGERIVNWCPRCESTLADDEVEYREEKSKFYYFKYGPVIIGTARPETKFLDKTIVVHPKDKRYKDLVGKKFMVPWIDGAIEANVISDPVIDMNFGTGAMTITPAHSFEDFDIAKKHKLPIVKIIDEKGNFTKAAGKFAGRNARACRAEIVEELKKRGLLEKIDDRYAHNLSVCYRCSTPVEPLAKDQWWIDVQKKVKRLGGKSLKEASLEAVKNGSVRFVTKRFEKMYYHWMENLRDWCISRQIWYGHRMPVWYCKQGISNSQFSILNEGVPNISGQDIKNLKFKIDSKFKIRNSKFGECPPIVSVDPPKNCPECGNTKLEQDPDTLDTWFSSGLWTFSTLGWPNQTKDLKTFHPTSFMETGYDIIFFWVARMILMTLYHMGEVPFHEVYLHGLVRDKEGRKMSKSLGNIIDPLDVCKKYGTDAVRLSLLIGNTPGNDLNLGEEKIAGFRNFTNKLWNISRYIFLSVESVRRMPKAPKPKTIFDSWILGRFHAVQKKVTEHLERHEFSSAGDMLKEFTWNDFADWYLEMSKVKSQMSKVTDNILLYILERLLILWHPFMPFVTEEIWKNFSSELLMIQAWPKAPKKLPKPISSISDIQKIIIAIRNLKAEHGVSQRKDIALVLFARKSLKIFPLLQNYQAVIERLSNVEKIEIHAETGSKPKKTAFAAVAGTEIHLEVSGIIHIDVLRREISEKEKYIRGLELKLKNSGFLEHAPKEVVRGERMKLEKHAQELEKMRANLSRFAS